MCVSRLKNLDSVILASFKWEGVECGDSQKYCSDYKAAKKCLA